MKKLMKFSLATLCITTLAACSGGSGGSSGGNNSSSQQRWDVATQKVQPSNVPTVAAAGLKNAMVNPSSVTVDGKQFQLAPGGDYRISAANVEIVKEVEGAQYMGFVSEGRGKQRYSYYGSVQVETSEMPISGVARYEGDVVYSYGGILEADDRGVADGDIHLTADFANKTLVGTIDDAIGGTGARSYAQVNATISGSGFTGKVSTPNTSADLSGKFYGIHAANMAGVFGDKNNTLSGAFEADRK